MISGRRLTGLFDWGGLFWEFLGGLFVGLAMRRLPYLTNRIFLSSFYVIPNCFLSILEGGRTSRSNRSIPIRIFYPIHLVHSVRIDLSDRQSVLWVLFRKRFDIYCSFLGFPDGVLTMERRAPNRNVRRRSERRGFVCRVVQRFVGDIRFVFLKRGRLILVSKG